MLTGDDRSGVPAHVDNMQLGITVENMRELFNVVGLFGEVEAFVDGDRGEYADFMLAITGTGEARADQFHQ